MTDDRRLRPPEEHEKTIETLVKSGIFETKQAALTFAAAVGYFRNERRPLTKAGEGVRWQVFERNQDSAFIYALAIAVEGSISVLDPEMKDKDTIAEVFEEYAAGGFDRIEAQMLNGSDALDALLLMLAEARRDNIDRPEGLEGLSQGALDALGL